ncbi:CBS domain-containing protein CBSX1, chloroplastic isoform X1 [Gossypium hirsutum]|uniref:CBS domain-containing protein CBSX1, chloroplastic isoform X1 n=1 Tax=Gossypium hirsutum TaxID=3635 RepID=A0A1U8J9M5_GOSHI|nr:CBS domain-containing protein CBSX1, chloroplastic-like isoform X1 [Gossypium hirsutum]
MQPRGAVYTVGDFMTGKEDLHVVKPTTTVDKALEALVEHRIIGFPVINDDWKLTFNEVQKLLNKTNGLVVSDLMTPAPLVVRETTNLKDAARSIKLILPLLFHMLITYFHNIRFLCLFIFRHKRLLLETKYRKNFKLLLETKYRRLPVVDVEGKLVGIITRGNIVRAALQIKREIKGKA